MTDQRLAEAWPHLRRAVEILIYGTEFQVEPQPTIPAVSAVNSDPEDLKRQIRDILDQAEPIATDLAAEFEKARYLRGAIATVARELGLSHEHVRQVAHGGRKSARVSDALRAEIARRTDIGDAA